MEWLTDVSPLLDHRRGLRHHFRSRHKFHSRWISRPNFAKSLSIEGNHPSVIFVSEWQKFCLPVNRTHRRIKNHHLPCDSFEDAERPLPPNSPVVESVKRTKSRDIVSGLAAQLHTDGVRVKHQIILIETKGSVMS